jgi:hypothetical protein
MSKFDDLVRAAKLSSGEERTSQQAAVRFVESVVHGFADYLGCGKEHLRYISLKDSEGGLKKGEEIGSVSDMMAAAAIIFHSETKPKASKPMRIFFFTLAVDLGDGRKPALLIRGREKNETYKMAVRHYPEGEEDAAEGDIDPKNAEDIGRLHGIMFHYLMNAVKG